MKHKNKIKLLADGKTISRLVELSGGAEVRVQSRNNGKTWVWCTYIGGKEVGIMGTVSHDKFNVTDLRFSEHARTYRRGQPVSEGIMIQIHATS